VAVRRWENRIREFLGGFWTGGENRKFSDLYQPQTKNKTRLRGAFVSAAKTERQHIT
jgi:hypothetical protein